MSPLDLLFGQVKQAISQHGSPDTPGPAYDTNGILGQLSGLFGQHSQQIGQPFESGNQDNQQYGQVAPASQDPFGDPADQPAGGQFGQVAPASQDPFGDPADQQR